MKLKLGEMNEQQIKEILYKIVELLFINNTEVMLSDYQERDTDIFFSRGYDHSENTTVLFCIKGSPNRFYGYMDDISNSDKDGVHIITISSNLGKFYSNGKEVTRRKNSNSLCLPYEEKTNE